MASKLTSQAGTHITHSTQRNDSQRDDTPIGEGMRMSSCVYEHRVQAHHSAHLLLLLEVRPQPRELFRYMLQLHAG